ncbi:putative ribonuclease H protein [Vitis vinifera]|uniref:Putative ribonuclease H protein n=1 Tax=Vitis vinifera TaxID=29760 RepID=A0A438HLM7_VITVI|nr:putative ribonuclease H protein [Vitis vinifera]
MGIGSEVDLGLRMEMEFIKCREKETWDKQTPALQWSMADREIMDEAFRYGSYSNLKVGEFLSSSSPLFGRTPLREPCDHSGVLRVCRQSDILVEGAATGGDRAGREGCWDLVVIDCEAIEVQNPDWTPAVSGPQAQRSEKESDWEESSLAKFSKLLGFSIEGLEREILDFLSKIRKRRERIHSKGLLEKTKFERELKRGANDVNKRRIIKSVVRKQKVDLMCIQETKIQSMTDGVVKSLGVGRFLDWRTLEAAGAAGGVLVCWDKSLGFHGGIWPFQQKDRECLWEELGAVRGLWGDPWCVGGDFNVTLAQGERSRQGRVTPAMRRFAQVMDDLELVDLPLQGGSFTWSGGLYNQAWARLDRFLVSPRWLDQFSNVTQKRLSRPISDHFPITIEGGGKRRGPSPFRFENMWLRVEGFKDLLRSWWQGMVVSGRASYKLATKLKGMKEKLKVWNREVFGNLETNKMAALQQVDHWDQVESERRLFEEEFARKKEAKDGYAKWVKMDEIHWRQLSRELWLREGDKNTGYFHRMANAHRRRNAMERVKISGVWLSEERTVRTGIVDAFHRLLTEDSEWKADIGGVNLNRISQQEADILELPFTEEEVHSAIRGMNGDKAPGSDGFTGAFWQFCWEFVNEEVMEMFKEFHEHKTFLKSLNATFLVLIPKKGGAEELGTSGRSACWVDYTNSWLRQILDASLIANEVIDSWKKGGKKGLICNGENGFGTKWREWIWSCISTAKFSVLVNGEPAGFFPSSKGLRQGDPLSPYLFIMGMEVLSAFIRRAVEGGCITGCRMQRGRGQAVSISHLLFADDAIVFLGEVDEILEMAVELGCKVGQLPSTYLGLPLGAPNKAGYVWDGVEERMRWKLALWKRQYLSKGGRITLIKSTLASMPLYQLSLFRMPKGVARRLEKLQRDFLWGGGSTERKAHLVSWEKDEMWKRVLVAKYGQEDFGWRTKKANGAFGVGLWKEIMKEAYWCWNNITFKVGKGTKIRFWKDTWCGDVELARSFPQLFNVAAQKGATVGDLWDQNAGQGEWNLRFLRSFNDWELPLVEELLQILRNQRINLEEDLALWKGGKNGQFGVKDAYGLLTSHSTFLFPKKGIWVENVPSKLAFFAWEATWGRILTIDRLQREDDKSLTGVTYVSVWSPVGLSRNCKGGDYQLEGFLCGQKEEENMEIHTVVYFLDGVEGKE